MRIIAGDYKGRRLIAPADREVRPTSDKVKEAMFSMLQMRIEDAKVLDLFAGTGNLGLEALSRGAESCIFCDASRSSIKMIEENIKMCRAEEYSTVIWGDYTKALSRISGSEKMDIILLDPPYAKGILPKVLADIKEMDILADGGVIVCEHFKDTELSDDESGFEKLKSKHYGKVVLSLFV